MFAEISGLPLHPLVVHAVVVLVPVSTLVTVAVVVRTSWARAYAPLAALGALGAAVAAWVAREAGYELQERLGLTGETAALIEDHAQWGLYVAISASVFALLAVASAALALGNREAGARWVGAVAALAGVVATVLTYLAGDSGTEAVWGSLFGS